MALAKWLPEISPDGLADDVEDDAGGIEDPEGADGVDVRRQDVRRVHAQVEQLLAQDALQRRG